MIASWKSNVIAFSHRGTASDFAFAKFKNYNKRPVLWTISILTVVLAIYFIFSPKRIKFDPILWQQSNSPYKLYIRYQMKDDLLDKLKNRKEWNYERTRDMLGSTKLESEPQDKNEAPMRSILKYEIGEKYYGPIRAPFDFGWYLMLMFDERGNLKKASVYPH